jgi:Protein of unknown function (DUF3159)
MSGRGPDLSRYSARDILANRHVIDAVLPPIVFVTTYGFVGLVPAAVAALASSAALVCLRLVRGESVLSALGGVLGTLVATGVAVVSGRPENYFLPRAITNGVSAMALVATIMAGKPAVGLVGQVLYGFPSDWLRHPSVRRVYAEATWPWVGLCLLRSIVYLVLIGSGDVGWLAVVTTILGWPSFAALLVATYAFVRWRIARVDAPPLPA